MLQRSSPRKKSVPAKLPVTLRRRQIGGLQLLLWAGWTSAIIATAYLQWQRALLAHQAVPVIGFVVHASTVGLIGLIILTMIEMRLEPWRFYDQHG